MRRRRLPGIHLPFSPIAAFALALFLGGCGMFEALKQRAALFAVDFSLQSLDVSRLVYPSNWLGATMDIFSRDRSFLGRFGVDIHCTIKAANAKPQAVRFEGATGYLKVQDVSSSAPKAPGQIPAFSVPANGETAFVVTFPLRLDNPVFSKAIWKAIVSGSDIPYKVDAAIPFSLVGGSEFGLPDTLATRTITLNVTKGSVDAKAAGGSALERFLALLDKAF
jgi:hypothetical protein